jgi:hypothetical protein
LLSFNILSRFQFYDALHKDSRKERVTVEKNKNQINEKLRDMIQQIRMCVQTYFNLYGAAPGRQVILEWLGISDEGWISECLGQVGVT